MPRCLDLYKSTWESLDSNQNLARAISDIEIEEA
jgi:hypothetical protein